MQFDRREDIAWLENIAWLNEVLEFLQCEVLDQLAEDFNQNLRTIHFVEAFCREVYRRVAPDFEFRGEIVLFSPYDGLQSASGQLPCPAHPCNTRDLLDFIDRLSDDMPGTRAEALLRERFFPEAQMKINMRAVLENQPAQLNQELLKPKRIDFPQLIQPSPLDEQLFQLPAINNAPQYKLEMDQSYINRLKSDVAKSFGLTPDFVEYVLPVLELLFDVNGHYPDMCSWRIAYNDTLTREQVFPLKKLLHACGHSRARALHLRSWLVAWFDENSQDQEQDAANNAFLPGVQPLSELLLIYSATFASELAPSLRTQCLRWFDRMSALPEECSLPDDMAEALVCERSEKMRPDFDATLLIRGGEGALWNALDMQQRVHLWMKALNSMARMLEVNVGNTEKMVNDDPKFGWTATRKK